MGERRVDCSALPIEIFPSIAKANQDRDDVVRLPGVCASWRSYILSPSILRPFGPPLPSSGSARTAFVSYRTIYRIKLQDDVNPNPSTCSSKSWLVKVEESGPGFNNLLNPLSSLHFRFPSPKGINLLDDQVVEVSKEYQLQSLGSAMPIDAVNKIVLFPDSARNSFFKDTEIYVLSHERKLWYVKCGDRNWTLVNDLYNYDDIIAYKGKPYVVDEWGLVSWIDSSMTLIEFAPQLQSFGGQKYLVESRGELYVVDRFFDRERRFDDHLCEYRVCPKTYTFDVFKLDQECDRWVNVENLGDRVFILGKDSSFSVSAAEFSGCKGNCVYFTDEHHIAVFCFENQKTGKIVDFQDWSNLFWPPQSWFNSNIPLGFEFR